MQFYFSHFDFIGTKILGALTALRAIFLWVSVFFLFFFLLNFNSVSAQVCGTSGLDGPQNAIPPVNTYFPLATNTILTAGTKSITLQAVPPDDQNNNLSYGITSIKSGDLILIIQMQDASFDYSNNLNYGSGTANSGPDNLGGTGYTSVGESGKFEYVVAASDVGLAGGVLKFRGGGVGKGAVNTYTNIDATATSGQKRFQVVRVPQYSTLVLTTDLTTPPYNGSVGGIIAFDVAGTMKFNGFVIDASERGFRGGYGPVAGSGANNNSTYVVASNSTKSVGKGEGIAGTPRYMWDGFKQVDNLVEGLPGGSYGRGAPANAGGAGNDHNAGGGGGGNGGFGGLGGKGWQGAGGNISPLNAGGRPGHTFPVDPSKLIMGGGGGGGDANNATTGVKGGVGGGIVLVNVEKIDGIGIIKSNGGNGQAGAFGSAPDGAGGGGAGGTIFVRSLAASPSAILTLEANGGRGGNTENDNNNEHGPGGGGGGGFIYSQVSSSVISNFVDKGNSGKSNAGAGIQHGAVDGTDGIAQTFVTTDLPPHLQGGGFLCYPALDVSLLEINAGAAGMRASGTTATYKLNVFNNLSGGNAGDVRIDFKLPYGFSLANVTTTLGGDASSSAPLSFTVGATGKMNFGAYNISPGDFVELTLSVNIASNVPTGIYHASAQATYLDPTRTSANPIRKITAASNHFAGTNSTYETGGAGNVSGTNYNGDLSASTTEDVYINAPAIIGECSAIVDGGFSTTPIGEYDAPNYTGPWHVANSGDKVAIVNQDGLQGAAIKNNVTGDFSLKQKLAFIQPSSDYTLTFNYRNWTDQPCSSTAIPKIRVEILDAFDNSIIFVSSDFESQISPGVAFLNFSTTAATDSVLIKVYDAGSPITACGVFVDDFEITSPLSIVLEKEDVKCNGGDDGNLTITTLIGAAGPYRISYSADGGATFSIPLNTGIITSSNPFIIDDLGAGDYKLNILDENDCLNVRDFTVGEPAVLSVSGGYTDILCNGGFSKATVVATGGISPYQYSLNGVDFQSQSGFPNLVAGDYTVYVKDVNNCMASNTLTITEPTDLGLSADVTEIKCFGETASVRLTALGGTGAYKYSIDGLTFQDSNLFSDVLPGPQTFNVRDANECMHSVVVDIVEPSDLILSSTQTEIKCFGETAEIKLSANGGTTGYRYSKNGIDFQPTNSFSGLIAGNYNFVVKDANDCATTIAVSITEPSELKLASTHTEIKCFGETSEVVLSANGGTAGYQYSKDGTNFQPTNTFSGLIAGNYNFTVKDANDCETIIAVSITEPSELKLTSTQTEIKCFGETAEIKLSANGGTTGYQYSKNGVDFQPTNKFSGLIAGNYNFTVKDANDCATTIAVSITEPSELKLTSTQTEIKCFGETAEFALSAVGGIGTHSFSRNGIDFQPTNTFSGLIAGNYSFTVKDANDCATTIAVSITEPSELKLTSTQTEIKCFGETSEVTLSANGGATGYQYSKNGIDFQPTNTFSGLIAGNYNFTVKDANDCATTIAVSITEPSELKLTSTQTEIKCFGETAEVVLSANDGTTGYQYSKDGTNFQPTNTFSGLTAGNYNFTVKDANDCATTIAVSITEPSELKLTSTHTEIKCFGETAEVTLSANGGTIGYQYSKDGTNFQPTNTFSGLTAGDYSFTVKDANDCATTIAVSITEPSELKLTSTQTEIKCFGETAEVTMSANGGTTGYQYSKNGIDFQPTNTFGGLTAGNYNFTVKDANDCATTIAVSITEPSELKLTSTQTEIKCFGETAEVTLSANGGTIGYQYSKDGTNFQPTNTFSGLIASNYNFTVKDANDCATTITVSITEPSELKLTSTQTEIKCFGETAEIKLSAVGGTGTHSFSKNGVDFQPTNTFSGLVAGKYNFIVKDANDCATTIAVSIAEPSELKLTSTHTEIKCFGGTAEIKLSANGGTGAYQYSKDGMNFQLTNTFSNLIAGNYSFIVKDENNCTTSATVNINQPAQPLSITETHQNNVCYAESEGKIDIQVTGGTFPYQYLWSNGATTQNIQNLKAGEYQVTVTDKKGCSQSVAIQILPLKPFVIIQQTEQIKCFGGNSGKINLQLSGGEAPYKVTWSNGANGLTLQNLVADNYTYTATDAFGCIQTKTITISQPQLLSANAIVKNTTCKYSPDGGVKINVTGGTTPYRFIWNSTDRGQNSSLLNVNAGKYNITVIDANNCSVQLSAQVLPGNCAPSADNDRYETTEDTPIIINTPGVIVNDLDPDDDDLRITVSSAKDPNGETGDVDASKTTFKTKNGKVSLNIDGSFTYTPNKNFVGTEYFIYEVTDGELKSNFAQVTIVVTAVNDPPTATNDTFITPEDTPIPGDLGSNDTDPENETLTYVITNPPASGTVTLNPDGTFTYIPTPNFTGTITFDYQVCDPEGLCAQATATIVVTPVNDPPIAVDDKFSIQRNGQIAKTVVNNDSDADGDALTFIQLTNPTNGTLIFNVNGSFVYQPNPNFKGIDQFTYRACDPFGLCDNATVILVVQPLVTVNLTPTNTAINEGDSIKITAVLTESLVEDVIVYLSFSGTAINNQDYVLSDNYVSILIPANQTTTTQYFKITSILDDIRDDNENINGNINSTTKPTFVNIGTGANVTIKDVYPETVKTTPDENSDINPDPLLSPNGDGLGNESFIIYNIGKYPANEVMIFNRWGNKVYQTRGYDNKGNSFKGIANVGILTNSNKELVDGVYYYLIYTEENNKKKMNKGYLILKR